jgi:hypothetical protein
MFLRAKTDKTKDLVNFPRTKIENSPRAKTAALTSQIVTARIPAP